MLNNRDLGKQKTTQKGENAVILRSYQSKGYIFSINTKQVEYGRCNGCQADIKSDRSRPLWQHYLSKPHMNKAGSNKFPFGNPEDVKDNLYQIVPQPLWAIIDAGI
jgi:hypothetical protein